eukprot:4139400-Pyramimonas_sp.AAC.1
MGSTKGLAGPTGSLGTPPPGCRLRPSAASEAWSVTPKPSSSRSETASGSSGTRWTVLPVRGVQGWRPFLSSRRASSDRRLGPTPDAPRRGLTGPTFATIST